MNCVAGWCGFLYERPSGSLSWFASSAQTFNSFRTHDEANYTERILNLVMVFEDTTTYGKLRPIMGESRTISGGAESVQEQQFELSLRPKWLREYIGQQKAKENLAIFIQAARKRGQALDHVLLYEPPGLGK